MSRTGYPGDVSDEEWAFVAPYLTLMSETPPEREHSLRDVFNGLQWIDSDGCAVALSADRSAAVGSGLSTIATLA